MRIEDVKQGMVLSGDIVDDFGTLLLEKGITLTQAYITRLQTIGIRQISIADHYAEALKKESLISTPLRQELSLCFRALFSLKAEEILDQKLRSVYMRQLSTAVDEVIRETAVKLPNIINVQIRLPVADETDHAVNVCLLSVVTGIHLKFPGTVLRELALGALLHDLGKSLMPCNKQAANDPGFHCIAGQQLLRRCGVGLAAARIAAEHHEAFDGSGYPSGLTHIGIHPLSRVVAITNYFDNALSRTRDNSAPRHEILERMLGSGNTAFDLNILRAFCHTVAIYPVGSLVRLNTGQEAYVLENQPQFPLRPIVRLMHNNQPAEEVNLVATPKIIIEELIQE